MTHNLRALGMVSGIWLRRRWKDVTPMLVYASNWSFSIILKRYKNTHTTGWHAFFAAVHTTTNYLICYFDVSMSVWLSFLTYISNWLLLISAIQISFSVALAFFSIVWKVLLSKVFNRRRFPFGGWELRRDISSLFKSSSTLNHLKYQ